MKSLRILSITLVILSLTFSAEGQTRKTVSGNKNVVTKERKAGYFEGIKVSTGIDVFLKEGSSESISVEADENLQEYIITEIRDGVLHVYTEANIRFAERKRVYVTMKTVSSIRTSSAGDVIGETPFTCDKLELSASSAGSIKMDVKAKEIDADISSSGDITISGSADSLEASLSSAGDLNASELKTTTADVTVSSAGDAEINVSEKLIARASSAGDINYQGNPKYVDAHSSSAGGIHKR
jgi:hypothetical protein